VIVGCNVVPDVIRTGRAVLRPVQASDVDDILEYATDPEWSRYLIALPGSSYTRADAERFVASQAVLDWDVHPSWAIEFQDRAVGGINARFLHEHRVGELGYGLSPRLWGQGLVVEAARAVIEASFNAYPQLSRFRATTDARNARSLRVMEKLGMKREGLLRSDRFFRGELADEVVCGLLRSEWRC
jgi:ribosomal-protein-alanine N-acetyltransferase